jgi:hypothetical protein
MARSNRAPKISGRGRIARGVVAGMAGAVGAVRRLNTLRLFVGERCALLPGSRYC